MASVRRVRGAMAGTQQPLTGGVKHLVGLPVQFHRHMGAAVQVGIHCAVEAYRERPTSLTRVNHIKRHGFAGLQQVA